MCSPLVCIKCRNGTMFWIDDPDEVEHAKMMCRTCYATSAMKAYTLPHPYVIKVKSIYNNIRGKIVLHTKLRLKYLIIPWIKERLGYINENT